MKPPLDAGARELSFWDPSGNRIASRAAGFPAIWIPPEQASFLTLLLRSRLFPWVEPRLAHPRVTDDHFVLAIRQTDADLEPDMAERLLRQHGAIEVQEDIGGVTR